MQRRQVVITPRDADHVKEKNGRPKAAWRLPDGFANLRDGLWQLMVVDHRGGIGLRTVVNDVHGHRWGVSVSAA